MSLLSQKGIEADEQEIKELLMLLSGDKEDRSENQSNHKKKLINKINSVEGSWYLLPFDLIQIVESCEDEIENRLVLGNGCIRLLFNSFCALQLLNVDCNYNNQKYLFSLSFEGKKIKNTYFNVSSLASSYNSKVPENEILKLKKLFISYGVNTGNISWIEKNILEGNASGLETFVKFGGEV